MMTNNIMLKRIVEFSVVSVLVFYVFLFIKFYNTEIYLPSIEDEYTFFKNALNFYNTNSLAATMMIHEDVSNIFETDWHGIFYILFNGGIAKVFGFSGKYLIYVNFSLVLIAVCLIYGLKNVDSLKKHILVLMFLLYHNILHFIFLYMPEMLNLFFGVILSLIILKIHRKESGGGEIRKEIYLFYAAVIVAALFRPLWVFWLAHTQDFLYK